MQAPKKVKSFAVHLHISREKEILQETYKLDSDGTLKPTKNVVHIKI